MDIETDEAPLSCGTLVAEKGSPSPAIESNASDILCSLQNRANNLLAEFRAYQALLQSHQKSNEVETRVFRRGIESEVKSLKKIRDFREGRRTERDSEDYYSTEDDADSKQLHALRSSNLPFYEAVWHVARRSRGITALSKRFHGKVNSKPPITNDMTSSLVMSETRNVKGPPRSKKKGVLVDIVAGNGLEWIKLSTISEKRLLFEMAKERWDGYDDFSDQSENDTDHNDDDNGHSITDQEVVEKLELVRLAEELKAASKATRLHYQHPNIRFVLPKITEGVLTEVDSFLGGIRALGIKVECGPLFCGPKNSIPEKTSSSAANNAFDALLPSSIINPRLTDALNIDCTILLALVSDISHLARSRVSPTTDHQTRTTSISPFPYHSSILRQLEAEETSPMLPRELYPLISNNRTLKCTSHAAKRMREIAATMGTPSERIRANILLGEADYHGLDCNELRAAFAAHTTHDVPQDLTLPIIVVEYTYSSASPAFPCSAAAMKGLSPINTSVFMYGWQQGIVTVTSNRAVATGIEKTINNMLDSEEQRLQDDDLSNNNSSSSSGAAFEFRGPMIYCVDTARSLVGKDKIRREKSTVERT